MLIPVKAKYRHEGKWPKSQPSDGTPNGGDAYLFKNKLKKKLGEKAPNKQASLEGMRHLVITPGGRGVWRYDG